MVELNRRHAFFLTVFLVSVAIVSTVTSAYDNTKAGHPADQVYIVDGQGQRVSIDSNADGKVDAANRADSAAAADTAASANNANTVGGLGSGALLTKDAITYCWNTKWGNDKGDKAYNMLECLKNR